jgi:hypothetical protein
MTTLLTPSEADSTQGPSRREVLLGATAAVVGMAAVSRVASALQPLRPTAIASANGLAAVAEAVRRMQEGSSPVEAAVVGVVIVEADPEDVTVGYGGLPNADGVVQLDASCMDGPSRRAGAVAAVERVKHPARLAYEVMRRTTGVMLVGEGAALRPGGRDAGGAAHRAGAQDLAVLEDPHVGERRLGAGCRETDDLTRRGTSRSTPGAAPAPSTLRSTGPATSGGTTHHLGPGVQGAGRPETRRRSGPACT